MIFVVQSFELEMIPTKWTLSKCCLGETKHPHELDLDPDMFVSSVISDLWSA